MSAWSPLVLFGTMLALMALRLPIWVAMFVPGAAGFAAYAGGEALLAYLKGIVFARFSIYDLSVIPLFLLMGQLATEGGLSRALFRAAASFVGHWRGGLAQAAVLASAAFGAVCGSSVATAATIAQVALPEMRRYRYDGGFAMAALAAGGTLGILIPPSVVLVLYAIIAEQNIAKLFAAALVPGLLAALLYCIAIAVLMRWRPALGPAEPRVPWRQRWTGAGRRGPCACNFSRGAGRHLRRRVYRHRSGGHRRRADGCRRPAATPAHAERREVCIARDRRSVGRHLHDLPGRRHAQWGTRAHADAGARGGVHRHAAAATAGDPGPGAAGLHRARQRHG